MSLASRTQSIMYSSAKIMRSARQSFAQFLTCCFCQIVVCLKCVSFAVGEACIACQRGHRLSGLHPCLQVRRLPLDMSHAGMTSKTFQTQSIRTFKMPLFDLTCMSLPFRLTVFALLFPAADFPLIYSACPRIYVCEFLCAGVIASEIMCVEEALCEYMKKSGFESPRDRSFFHEGVLWTSCFPTSELKRTEANRTESNVSDVGPMASRYLTG